MSATDMTGMKFCGLCFDRPIIPGADRCIQCADKSASLLAVRSHMLFIGLQAEREKVASLKALLGDCEAFVVSHQFAPGFSDLRPKARDLLERIGKELAK